MASNQESEIKAKLAELPGRNMKCDVVFHVGDYSFLARKDVLMLRMEYFRGMFTADLQEKNQTFVKLDPHIVDPAVFDDILDYVYTLNIDFTYGNFESIYKAADFFCFDELKAKTEDFMKSNINMNNVSLILDFALKFDLKDLEGKCNQFIILNPFLNAQARMHPIGHLSYSELSTLLRKLSTLGKFEDMFHSSIEWILYDNRNRSKKVSELLQMIPLRRLSQTFCKKIISKNIIVRNDNKCLQLLFDTVVDNPPVEELYVFGGIDEVALSSISSYDSSTRQWLELTPMPQALSYFAYCVVNQMIYVCGGHDGVGNTNALYMFDRNTHKWTTLNAMRHRRQACAMAALDGHLYVAGGYDYDNRELSVVERYSIQNNEWTTVSSMINKRHGLQLVQMNGLLYALGGYDGTYYIKSIEQYNQRTDKWTTLAYTSSVYSHFGSAVLNNRIYVLGEKSCEEYNPEENQSRIMAPPTECGPGRRLAAFDGKLYAIGGRIGGGEPKKGINTVEYYDFEKRSWNTAKVMNIARCSHGVAVITRNYTPE